MHLWSDRVLFEVRDAATGEIRREGSGSLLVTPLYREAMPLVRYELGDQARICFERCNCGSEFPTVEISGRQGSAIEVAGQSLFARELEELIYRDFTSTGILFWRARAKAGGLEVEIHSRIEGAADKLRDIMTAELKMPVDVNHVPANHFVPRDLLTRETVMQKPRYVFSADEDWNQNLSYAGQEATR
jgi:phenylacetate-CoA ligase